jgi:hypothetical protein
MNKDMMTKVNHRKSSDHMILKRLKVSSPGLEERMSIMSQAFDDKSFFGDETDKAESDSGDDISTTGTASKRNDNDCLDGEESSYLDDLIILFF